jgi:hypothetical protein
MLNQKVLAQSILASLALLTLSQSPKANALPDNWVQRGPHGAIQVVDGDRLPIGTTALPTSAAHRFPKLANKGPHGAAQLTNNDKMDGTMSDGQSSEKSDTKMMKFQSKSDSQKPTYQSANRRSVEELLEITDPLI